MTTAVSDRWLSVRGRSLWVCEPHLSLCIGRLDEPSVLPAACAIAGVTAVRLVESEGLVKLRVTYASGVTEDEGLTTLDRPGAWQYVPPELFDAFEEIVDEENER